MVGQTGRGNYLEKFKFFLFVRKIHKILQLFNGLVEMDKELNVVPSVAKSWKISLPLIAFDKVLMARVFAKPENNKSKKKLYEKVIYLYY